MDKSKVKELITLREKYTAKATDANLTAWEARKKKLEAYKTIKDFDFEALSEDQLVKVLDDVIDDIQAARNAHDTAVRRSNNLDNHVTMFEESLLKIASDELENQLMLSGVIDCELFLEKTEYSNDLCCYIRDWSGKNDTGALELFTMSSDNVFASYEGFMEMIAAGRKWILENAAKMAPEEEQDA